MILKWTFSYQAWKSQRQRHVNRWWHQTSCPDCQSAEPFQFALQWAEQDVLNSARLTKCHTETLPCLLRATLNSTSIWGVKTKEGLERLKEQRDGPLTWNRRGERGIKRRRGCKLSKDNWRDDHKSSSSERKGGPGWAEDMVGYMSGGGREETAQKGETNYSGK